MDAAFIHAPRDIRMGTLPEPRHNDRVLLEVATVGVCGSDLHYYLEGSTGAVDIAEPFVMGHEFSAYLAEDRPDLGLKRGRLVAVDPAKPCHACEWCRRGHENLCPNVVFTGSPPHHGALTRLIAVDPEQVVPVPESFTPVQAMMLEPLGVAIHVMDLARVGFGETVAVLGLGPIGLKILQLVRLTGAARVYGVDPLAYRRAVAERYGADGVVEAASGLAALTQGRGVDLVLEATNTADALQDAADAVAIGGRIVLAGIPEGDTYTTRASTLRRKGARVKLSRRMGHVYPRAIDLVARGRVDVESLVTHTEPLEETARAFERQASYADGVVKTAIVCRA